MTPTATAPAPEKTIADGLPSQLAYLTRALKTPVSAEVEQTL